MISVALKENLEEVSARIRILRLATDGRVPLIVGGGILKIGLDAAQRATGANHVTNSPAEALRRGGHEWRTGAC